VGWCQRNINLSVIDAGWCDALAKKVANHFNKWSGYHSRELNKGDSRK